MAHFKKLFSTLMHHSRFIHCHLLQSRTHLLLISLLLLSLFLLSTSFTDHSPTITATALYSRLLFATKYISPFSSISSSNSCLVSDSVSNCTLSSVTTVERTRGNPREDESNMIKDLISCDMFNGSWVLDYSSPLYRPGSCPFIDEAFNCLKNGRPDSDYLRYKWKPHGCHIPRFNGRKMLEMLRGKRLVFVGDSLNRNMWESLLCALRESLQDKSRIFEVSGRREFRTPGFYSFKFIDYKCSIDFIKSPFLVQEWRDLAKAGGQKETLRLDMIHGSSSKYHDADIIIFNTGHWWTHQKTHKGNYYFQEGGHVYNRLEVAEAYTKALNTWAQWVDAHIDSNRTRVFFRGYSASHFRKGQWYSGGHCDGETQPVADDTNYYAPYPWMMSILESVIAEMKTPIFYLNITKMTDYRKDGHPSIYRRSPGTTQDCSHWCLPGVPDSWNELLYATLLLSYHDLRSSH
ncbi:PC-Esterase domain-containing protein/PMR5N domain-containing protein [Cephalotus follicularis]|uniref:PC-Esterase domain-containing protein/PMR5N domain-containing protein n=1 Tax=Cephalotus follicularis TaxID=3775 RepID=A0A1Q3DG34_CEPFO|nr:PC-Esterase domain-containing protein/PMR5N domain-containing protein [Cephalotus follicularis]